MRKQEPLILLNAVLAMGLIVCAIFFDVPDTIAAISLLALSTLMVVTRTFVVPRAVMMKVIEQRDEVREMTRISEKEAEDWRVFYRELSEVVAMQSSVIERLKSGLPAEEQVAEYKQKRASLEVPKDKVGAEAEISPNRAEAMKRRLGHTSAVNQFAAAIDNALAMSIKSPTGISVVNPCQHEKAVDVFSMDPADITAQVLVAKWCPECSTQITEPGWLEQDLVDEEKRVIRGRTVADLKPPPKGPAPGGRRPRLEPVCRSTYPTSLDLCQECGELASLHSHESVNHAYLPGPCSNCGMTNHDRDDCPYPS